MPLVSSSMPVAQLREMLEDQRKGLDELLEMLADPPARVTEPLSVLTAQDLVRAALVAARPRADATSAELAASVNLLYESFLAAIDLLKVHSEMPKVPRGRKAPAPE